MLDIIYIIEKFYQKIKMRNLMKIIKNKKDNY